MQFTLNGSGEKVCVYIYMRVGGYTCNIYVHIYSYMHIYTFTCTYIYTHLYKCIYIQRANDKSKVGKMLTKGKLG